MSEENTGPSRAAMVFTGLGAVVALVVASVLAGGSNLGTTGATAGAHSSVASATQVKETGETTHVEIGVQGMSFTPSVVHVPAGNRLHITFTNTAEQRHDLVLASGQTTGSLAPGASAELDAGVITANTEGWCSLPGHREMGMTLSILADGAPGGSASAGSHSGGASHNHEVATGTGIPTADQLRAYAAKVDPYPAEVAPASEEKDHYYTLVARDDIVQNLSEDVSRTVWTFNGNTPAPTLRGKIGDTFHITLKNEGTMGHSLDFHAGDIAPDEAMKTIDPGQTLEYTFTAKAAGIWMYHCSTHPMSMHIANGMTGAVIIDPSDLRPVDHEYAMVATELYLGDNGGTASATKIASMMPDLQAFNGRPFQYDAHPLKVKVGERVRFWLMDSGPNTPMSFHIVGGQFDTVWDEGGYTLIDGGNAISRGGGGSQTFPMLPAQGGFVELSFKEPGTYTFVNHVMSLAEAGAHGKIEVTN